MIKKTYTQTTVSEQPRLTIQHDEWPISPREDSNLGLFITVDSDHYSPDHNETAERIIKDTGDDARDAEHHMELITKMIHEETDERVVAIYPVCKYEHGGIVYRLGTSHGFDYSNNGFYIVTEAGQKELGADKKNFEEIIKQELGMYTDYINGEVYAFNLCDEHGAHIDSCSGFYNIEDIKEYLPKEWQNEDMQDYLILN